MRSTDWKYLRSHDLPRLDRRPHKVLKASTQSTYIPRKVLKTAYPLFLVGLRHLVAAEG